MVEQDAAIWQYVLHTYVGSFRLSQEGYFHHKSVLKENLTDDTIWRVHRFRRQTICQRSR